MWLSTAGIYGQSGGDDEDTADLSTLPASAQRFAAAEGFGEVHELVSANCSMCHATEPLWEGMASPPKGVRLETEAQVALHAKAIWLQAGVTHAMPPANLTYMEEDARAMIRDWYAAGLEG